MPNGLSQDQMLERLYTEMVGLDGQSGMVREHRDMKGRVDNIASTMVTKPECAKIRSEAGTKKDKLLMRTKDIILLIIAIIGCLVGLGIISR